MKAAPDRGPVTINCGRKMSVAFEKYAGINYFGAETCETSLRPLRVYLADRVSEPREVASPSSPRKNWTRKAIAHWLVQRLWEPSLTLVAIDHGFSFPLRYFEKYKLPHDWPSFLSDFQKHWPTDADNTYVDFVREGEYGNGAARRGDSRCRRITEVRAGAKSVFHFDVPGQCQIYPCWHSVVAFSPHARGRSSPFLAVRRLEGAAGQIGNRRSLSRAVEPHLHTRWPRFPSTRCYAAAEWLRRNDLDGNLEQFFSPGLTAQVGKGAEIEGWIVGIA
jgi:hypothetical protein